MRSRKVCGKWTGLHVVRLTDSCFILQRLRFSGLSSSKLGVYSTAEAARAAFEELAGKKRRRAAKPTRGEP